MDRPQATRPAWKEPMVWLVAAIPAASVVASVALLVSAARSSGNDDAVADRVQRTAQIQVADLAPDHDHCRPHAISRSCPGCQPP